MILFFVFFDRDPTSSIGRSSPWPNSTPTSWWPLGVCPPSGAGPAYWLCTCAPWATSSRWPTGHGTSSSISARPTTQSGEGLFLFLNNGRKSQSTSFHRPVMLCAKCGLHYRLLWDRCKQSQSVIHSVWFQPIILFCPVVSTSPNGTRCPWGFESHHFIQWQSGYIQWWD